jgi:hypothetical protein
MIASNPLQNAVSMPHPCTNVLLQALAILAVCATGLPGCDDKPATAMKGQVNATVRFYGLAVDQDGNPLPGVRVEYQVDAYPKDWTFETRGRPYDTSVVSVASGHDGRLEFEATGCILRMKKVEKVGYRHLWETNGAGVGGYGLIAWEEATFKTSAANPAIFVLVKDGVREVSALPSPGGARRGDGKQWIDNKPQWPRWPSLKDVVFKEKATQQK